MKRPKQAQEDSRELLSSILGFMKSSQGLSMKELISIYSSLEPKDSVPLSVFSTRLSPSEALCKYLKERGLSYHDIAILLNRDDRSVWTSCARAARKTPKSIATKPDDLLVPISIFTDRSKSIFENLVAHLKSQSYSNAKMAKLLNRQQGSVATIANRAESKDER